MSSLSNSFQFLPPPISLLLQISLHHSYHQGGASDSKESFYPDSTVNITGCSNHVGKAGGHAFKTFDTICLLSFYPVYPMNSDIVDLWMMCLRCTYVNNVLNHILSKDKRFSAEQDNQKGRFVRKPTKCRFLTLLDFQL